MRGGGHLSLAVIGLLLSGCTVGQAPPRGEIAHAANGGDDAQSAATGGVPRSHDSINSTVAPTAPTPTLAQWRAEATAHGETGIPATIAIDAETWHIEAPSRVSSSAAILEPGSLFPARSPLLYILEPSVNGKSATWLVIEGPSILAFGEATSVEDVKALDVTSDGPALHMREQLRAGRNDANFSDWDDANRSLTFAPALPVGFTNVVLSNYSRAEAYFADGSKQSFQGEGIQITNGTGVFGKLAVRSDSWTTRLGVVQMSGNATSGHVRLANGSFVDNPHAILGRNATVFVDHSGISSNLFHATQVIGQDGALLPAKVEIYSEAAQDIHLTQGTSERFRGIYRERSFAADAALANVSYDGDAASMLSLPLQRPPDMVSELFGTLSPDLGLAFPFVAITVAAAAFALGFGEMFGCMLGSCPDQTPVPPFPPWISAGAVGEFAFEVNTENRPPGVYDGSIVVQGANYERVILPVHVTIEPSNS